MRRLTDISLGSVSTLLPIYLYYSVLVSYRFLHEATYRLSFRLLRDAIGCRLEVFASHILYPERLQLPSFRVYLKYKPVVSKLIQLFN